MEKKSYETPALVVFGDIREITQTVGMGKVDDGGGMADKSQ